MEDKYALPSKEKLREIAARQDEQEKKNLEKRAAAAHAQRTSEDPDAAQREDAAEVIQVPPTADEATEPAASTSTAADDQSQRNYRGYRERRQLIGHGLSATTRWTEAVKTARYENKTKPRARENGPTPGPSGEGPASNRARSKWQQAGAIARHAENDDTSDTSGEEGMTEAQVKEHRERKRKKKAEREAYAKTMGLEYFLEMVDQKHRYGSSLRHYHRVWQQSESKDNFFYWLDYGEGRNVDLEERPRERLDREQIRYLSREQRQRYQVKIGKDGLFRYAKNDELITTSPEFRDSIDGIVPISSKRPTWREAQEGKTEAEPNGDNSGDDSDSDADSISSSIGAGSNEDASRYVNQAFHDAKGLAKVKHISTSALMNNLLRKTTKKNTWIFVADTSFRVYVGIKQSGAFQHSSFLHGGRVAAAGLIRIKRGQLRRLDPLSGHYAPPAENFRGFVKCLREEGADMSHVSISRSYAMLLGLETYIGAKKKLKDAGRKVADLANPEEARRREEKKIDQSESAKKERKHLQAQQEKDAEKSRSRMSGSFLSRMYLRGRDGPDNTDDGRSGAGREALAQMREKEPQESGKTSNHLSNAAEQSEEVKATETAAERAQGDQQPQATQKVAQVDEDEAKTSPADGEVEPHARDKEHETPHHASQM